MKPDFEKMAGETLESYWNGAADVKIAGDLAASLRAAYAAGYRDGQARMQERCFADNSLEAIDKMEIEEPPGDNQGVAQP